MHHRNQILETVQQSQLLQERFLPLPRSPFSNGTLRYSLHGYRPVCLWDGTPRRTQQPRSGLEDPPLFSDRFTQYCPSLLSDTTGLGTLKKSVTKVMSQEELNTRSI